MKLLLAGLAVSAMTLGVLDQQTTRAALIAADSFDSYAGDIGGGAGGSGWVDSWTAATDNTVAQSTSILSYSTETSP